MCVCADTEVALLFVLTASLMCEQILKLLDNEDMDPSELDGIKDDVDYYIEVLLPATQCLQCSAVQCVASLSFASCLFSVYLSFPQLEQPLIVITTDCLLLPRHLTSVSSQQWTMRVQWVWTTSSTSTKTSTLTPSW